MNKWAAAIVFCVLALVGFIYIIYEDHDYDFDESKKSYEIVEKWNLPNILDEISGMVWLGNDKIACVQDEEGIVFIYDLSRSEIVHRTKFAGPGDYEALTRLNNEFWVAESTGKLFRISSLASDVEMAEVIDTKFEYKNNVEGLTATPDGNLLIAVKERNLPKDEGEFKAFYLFDPQSKLVKDSLAFSIAFNDPAFSVLHIENEDKFIRPSDVTYSPEGSLYVLDAEMPKLLEVSESGEIRKLHLLDPEEFFQPEGICFSPSGRMFISNEGKGGDPNILEVRLK